MINRLVKLTFKTEQIPDFLQIFEESKDFIRAFPGNHRVELLQDTQDPRIFFTYSWWENEEALEAYRHSELFQKTWARTKVLFDARPEAWSTRFVDAGISDSELA